MSTYGIGNEVSVLPDPQVPALSRVRFASERGPLEVRYAHAPDAAAAVLWLSGATGRFTSPGGGLYAESAIALTRQRISSAHVHYRHSTLLDEATHDALATLALLRRRGLNRFAIVGHSFGGAVAIRAAAGCRDVSSVVTLASQCMGIERVRELAGRCSLLIIHGADDESLPVDCSRHVFNCAGEPKQLLLLPRGRHFLDEVAPVLRRTVEGHLVQALGVE